MGHNFSCPLSDPEDERCWQVLAEPKRPQVTERLLRLLLGVQETDHEVIGSTWAEKPCSSKWRDMGPFISRVQFHPIYPFIFGQ